MALKRVLCAGLRFVSTLPGACRSVSVCAGPGCVDPLQNHAGGVPASGAGAAGGEPGALNESGAAGAGEPLSAAGGEAGAPEGGGEAGMPEGQPPVCDPDWGDCDGSSLNGCESDLHVSLRHCGACGAPCAGLCMAGTCKNEELLFVDGSPRSRVATQGALFTVMTNLSGDRTTLYRFDVISGEASELFELFGWDTHVSLGNDRVYVKDAADVRAITFDGERVAPVMGPNGPLSVWYFGATSTGLYSVDSDDDALVWTLSYQANQASDWKVIYEGGEIELMSAGSQAIALLSGNWDTENRELMLAIDGELTTLGTVPEGWADISVYEDRVAVLSAAGDLAWYGRSDEPPVQQTIPSDFYSDESFVTAPDGLAIVSDVGHERFVQCYSSEGTAWTPVGISRDATLVFANRRHLWYLLTPSWVDPPLLMRARLFEHDDL